MENQLNTNGVNDENSNLQKNTVVNLHQEPSILDDTSAGQSALLSLSPHAPPFVFNGCTNVSMIANTQHGYYTCTTSTNEQNNTSNMIDLNSGGEVNYEDLDYHNQCEITEVLQNILANSIETIDYDINETIDDADLAVMEELEEEIESTSNQSLDQPSKSFLPSGATPEQNGVLSAHAAEFWFPESRDCACCKGYKHGCECRAKGSRACTYPNCVNQEFSSQVESTLASRSNGHDATPTSSASRREETAAASRPRPPVNNTYTAKAATSAAGLPRFADEFWFPESRDCVCCKGYKHGCDCCKNNGVLTCTSPNCVNVDFLAGVQATLASRDSQPNTAPSGGLYIQPPSSNNSYSTPSYSSSNSGGGGGYSKSRQLCRYFAEGRCQYGDSCQFSHSMLSSSSGPDHSTYSPHADYNASLMSYGAAPLPTPSNPSPSVYPPSPYYQSYGQESEYPEYYEDNSVAKCREDRSCPYRSNGRCPSYHSLCEYLLQNLNCPLGNSCRDSHEERDLFLYYSMYHNSNYNMNNTPSSSSSSQRQGGGGGGGPPPPPPSQQSQQQSQQHYGGYY